MLLQSLKSIFVSTSVAFVFLATATTVTAQVEPQQGAINTSRSNLKNITRQAQTGPAIKGVWVKLTPSSGNARITTTDDQGTFSFADVSPGEYVLTFSATELKADTTSERSSATVGGLGTQLADLSARSLDNKVTNLEAPLTARIAVTGAATPIEKAWPVKVKHAANAKQRDGHTRFDPVTLDASAKTFGPGRPVFGNINLLMDSSSSRVGGHVSLIK